MKYYQITDAAKKVDVESHVLRYWEEELELPIERNKQGHRLYTEEDLNRFLYIKELKKEGLQLRAIRAKVHPGELKEETTREAETQQSHRGMALSAVVLPAEERMRDERATKLCMMLQQMVGQAVRKENQMLMSELKRSVADTVSKEMNYQFRIQEQREEEHYQKIDALLREKSGKKRLFRSGNGQNETEKDGQREKQKRKQKKTKAEKEKEMLLAKKQQDEENAEK